MNPLGLFHPAVKQSLKFPETNFKSAGNRSFHFQAAEIWNSLLVAFHVISAVCRDQRRVLSSTGRRDQWNL